MPILIPFTFRSLHFYRNYKWNPKIQSPPYLKNYSCWRLFVQANSKKAKPFWPASRQPREPTQISITSSTPFSRPIGRKVHSCLYSWAYVAIGEGWRTEGSLCGGKRWWWMEDRWFCQSFELVGRCGVACQGQGGRKDRKEAHAQCFQYKVNDLAA